MGTPQAKRESSALVHPHKPGIVTLAGKPSGEPPEGTYYEHPQASGAEEMMEYAVVFEKGPRGWGAYAPDLSGLGAAAETFEGVELLIREGITAHIAVLRETGHAVPEPTTRVTVMSTAA